MKRPIITIVITIAGLFILLLIFIYSGIYNVSQLSPHNGIVRWMINTTKNRSIATRTNHITPPALNDTSMEIAGFKHYNENCVSCHGAPGEKMDEFTKGLTPKPPKLFEHENDMEPAEIFWIIKNGIKYTAMPAFGPTHSDKDIWNIAAFLKDKLPKMSPDEYKQWHQQYAPEHED